ncbi:hypothetical protein AB1Y20_007497 [Prymnesium parvum]|mmetsp:Transcript_18055/g.43184  ORF Transcript_18055/g.43184 Transcript_18055/m.43184 type:complete len:346 (-) Transcript_18055:365-1402(-)
MADDLALAIFSVRPYDRYVVGELLKSFPKAKVLDAPLNVNTAMLAQDCTAINVFVNDDLSAEVLDLLAGYGVKCITLRCAGFDRVDIVRAHELGITVLRVPAYSPYAVAEHAIALMMALNRQVVKAHSRVLQGNFDLSGLVGFDMHGKTVGVVGTGKIGQCAAAILRGFGCEVLVYDVFENQEVKDMGCVYVSLDELLARSSIISLHCPLLPSTRHIINPESIAKMKRGAMVINVSRGGLIDTKAVLDGLKSRQIGSLGMDVYENEAGVFFIDQSTMSDDQPGASIPEGYDTMLGSLMAHPNVLVTPHMAFLTQDAIEKIASVTVENLKEFINGGPCGNKVLPPK